MYTWKACKHFFCVVKFSSQFWVTQAGEREWHKFVRAVAARRMQSTFLIDTFQKLLQQQQLGTSFWEAPWKFSFRSATHTGSPSGWNVKNFQGKFPYRPSKEHSAFQGPFISAERRERDDDGSSATFDVIFLLKKWETLYSVNGCGRCRGIFPLRCRRTAHFPFSCF